MNFLNKTLHYRVCVVAAILFLAAPRLSHAQPKDEMTELGLSVYWETNVGGAPLANGKQSFVLWPHSTAKREYVTVRLGDRIIERIHGEEIDQAALEKAVILGNKDVSPPRLGLEGATKKANKLVATYKTLGKVAKLDEPHSKQLIFLVTLNKNGILQAIDAESGAILWKAEVGDSRLPMFGPGVSDDHVAVTNGNSLYIFDLLTGTLLNNRKLHFSPTAAPIAILEEVIVPSIDGRMVAYKIQKTDRDPHLMRTGQENRFSAVTSADRHFISWPSGSKLVLSKLGEQPVLWSSISVGELIPNAPVATQKGFVSCSIAGTVFEYNTEREGSLQWKSRLAVQVTKAPVVSHDMVFIVSDDSYLYALRLADGTMLWPSPAMNVKDIIAAGKKHVYVRNSSNAIVSIDLASGAESFRSNILFQEVLPNSINDRLFLGNSKGKITCMRELGADDPVFSTTLITENANSGKAKTTEDADTETKSTEEDSNLFDGAGETMSDDSGSDIFGSDPSGF